MEVDNCVAFRMITITSMAIGRGGAHMFFNDRLKGLSRPQRPKKNRLVKVASILVVFFSATQLAVSNIYSAMEEQPNASCNEGLITGSIGYYVYIGSNLLIGALQLVVLGLILLKLFNHSRLLSSTPSIRSGMRTSNLRMRKVLKRIGCSSAVFVVSDVMLVIYLIVRSQITYWHAYLASLNLTVNLISIVCSHNDYQKKFFPFRSSFRGSREDAQSRVNNVFNIELRDR